MSTPPINNNDMETIELKEPLFKKNRTRDTSAVKINNFINPIEVTSNSTSSSPTKLVLLEFQETPRINSPAYFPSDKYPSIAQIRAEARNEVNRPNTPPLHEILQRCHLSNSDIVRLSAPNNPSASNRSTPSTSYLSTRSSPYSASPSPKLDLPPLHPPSPFNLSRSTRTPTPISSLFSSSDTHLITPSPNSPTKPFLPKLDLSKVNK